MHTHTGPTSGQPFPEANLSILFPRILRTPSVIPAAPCCQTGKKWIQFGVNPIIDDLIPPLRGDVAPPRSTHESPQTVVSMDRASPEYQRR